MSATVQFNSTTQWNANTRVLFFDYNSEQVVSSTGALVADSDSARNAAAQTPTGDPGSVAIPTGTTPGTYYAYAYVGPTLATTDSPEYSWGDTLPLSWDGINLIYGPTVPTPTTGAYPLNVGANQGISGDVVFPTFSGVWRFTVYVVGDSWDLDAINDAGRGDGRWPASIPGSAHGMVTLTGKITRQACPNPTTLNGQLLTVTPNRSGSWGTQKRCCNSSPKTFRPT